MGGAVCVGAGGGTTPRVAGGGAVAGGRAGTVAVGRAGTGAVGRAMVRFGLEPAPWLGVDDPATPGVRVPGVSRGVEGKAFTYMLVNASLPKIGWWVERSMG